VSTIVERATQVIREAVSDSAAALVPLGVAVRALLDAGMLRTPPAPATVKMPERLRGRQVECLLLVEAGLTQPEIAARLFLSFETIRTHLTHARQLLGARTSAQAATIARNAGLLPEAVRRAQL
jgi:DNA-binding CsgD family transcriptional regulator